MTPLLLTSWLVSAPVMAQECDVADAAIAQLVDVVSDSLSRTGVDTFCPDDLLVPIDLEQADELAQALSPEGRLEAAIDLLAATTGIGAEHIQAVANAAALLDALLLAALANGEDVSAMIDALLSLAEEAEDPLLHRQISLNLWRSGVEDERVQSLIKHYLPDRPDYDSIFPDGTTEVKAILRTGYDGIEHSDFIYAFERQGATVTAVEEGDHYNVHYVVTPDDPTLPPITWDIDIVAHGFQPADAFSDMNNDAIDVSMFGDHSQLGTSLDRALEYGPEAKDSTDFFWVDACKSKVFSSRLSQAYPSAHFVFTKDSELFRDMPVSFERGLVAISNHYDYEQMERLVASGSAWQPRNYIFPMDPQKLVYQDQDGDGIADAEDRIYDVAAGGREGTLNGELASKAVHIANTYLAYSSAYVHHGHRLDIDVEDLYRPDGIFDGEAGGPATQIVTRADAFGEEKFFVAVSDELLEMEQSERTARISADIAIHQGAEQGWSDKISAAAAFLVGTAVYDVWYGTGWDDYRDATLPGLDLSRREASAYLDHHNFVTEESITRFISDGHAD